MKCPSYLCGNGTLRTLNVFAPCVGRKKSLCLAVTLRFALKMIKKLPKVLFMSCMLLFLCFVCVCFVFDLEAVSLLYTASANHEQLLISFCFLNLHFEIVYKANKPNQDSTKDVPTAGAF